MVRKAINNEQASRFQKVFDAYLRGDRPVSTTHDSQLFLEAAREQPTPSACVEKIIASPSGLRAVRHSVRASDNPRFISSHVLPFILYLSHPDVKSISEGKLLQQIVTTIVDPPTAWSAILGLYVEHGFVDADNNAETFAWLCLQIFTSAVSELIALAKELTTTLQKRPLLDHACHKVREYGQQIRKILKIQSSIGAATAIASDTETPGGRHDNDFADFRQISVYPTTDELASTRRPFYRRATEIAVSEPLQRAREHVDNQYRLLREDMLAELRDGIQMATGKKKKKGRYPAQALGELGLLHLDSGDEKRGRVCTLLVTVRSGLEFFHGMDPKQRRDYLVANTNILRHQAFGALCSGDVVIGFAFVHRDIDRLAEDPPVVGLQFTSSEVLVKVIDVFRMPQNLRFVLVDTPVFAYEPVLQRLKDITVLPLESQILRLDDHDTHVNFSPPEHLGAFLQRCQNQPSKETHTLQTGDTKCTLDVAQFDALVYALSTPLSTIQGPPGKCHSQRPSLPRTLFFHSI